ncbi:hypothetical protein ACI2KR_09030 [Pseudomonas luteola]
MSKDGLNPRLHLDNMSKNNKAIKMNLSLENNHPYLKFDVYFFSDSPDDAMDDVRRTALEFTKAHSSSVQYEDTEEGFSITLFSEAHKTHESDDFVNLTKFLEESEIVDYVDVYEM